ncbi:MAG: hypothetical protein ACOVO2_21340, partial [Emticicia sp.]|uniref:hypothetical protein n=1 Tax=Emticicia sp. TaxID=1930953 RepID=UPI003BA6BCD6
MKKISILSILCISLSLSTYSQAVKDPIGPVFYAYASQNISYPVGAIRGSIYGRVYASFEVNSTGKIKNVNVIYPLVSQKVSKSLGFENEIVSGLSKIPKLNHVEAGKYILPIAFVYKNMYYGDVNYPTNRISEDYFSKDFKFLQEIQITARSDQFRSLRPFSNIPPMSRQIVDY